MAVKLFLSGLRIVLFLFFISGFIYPQQIQFCKEKICIEVKKGECVLTGIYYFVNNSGKSIRQNLYYPYVVNDFLPLPYKAEVKLTKNDSILPVIKSSKGIIFKINVEPNDTTVVEVVYYQKTPENKMEYILTTTQKWGKPFAEAAYIVKIPSDFILEKMHPAFDKSSIEENYNIYYTLKKDYLPDHNFIVSWMEGSDEKITK